MQQCDVSFFLVRSLKIISLSLEGASDSLNVSLERGLALLWRNGLARNISSMPACIVTAPMLTWSTWARSDAERPATPIDPISIAVPSGCGCFFHLFRLGVSEPLSRKSHGEPALTGPRPGFSYSSFICVTAFSCP